MAVLKDSAPIRAAGGVLWRPAMGGGGAVEIALVHRPRYDDWSLPKGKLDQDEQDIAGAVREVLEETGHSVRLGRPLGSTTYEHTHKGAPRRKIVRYWAMRSDGGAFTPSSEVDAIRWLPIDAAPAALTHDRDREVVERFAYRPVQSGIVLLVRHASAGQRSKWRDDDRLRPLDKLGWKQARALRDVLAPLGIQQLLSADFVRCVQTLEPLGKRIGLPIQQEALFSERGWPGNEDEAVARVRALGGSGKVTAVSSQGDVIPLLLEALVPDDDGWKFEDKTKKGSVWILTFDDKDLESAEYMPPTGG